MLETELVVAAATEVVGDSVATANGISSALSPCEITTKMQCDSPMVSLVMGEDGDETELVVAAETEG